VVIVTLELYNVQIIYSTCIPAASGYDAKAMINRSMEVYSILVVKVN